VNIADTRSLNRRHRWSPLARLVLALALPGLIACTVRLIGDYDATIDQGVTAFHQDTEGYFVKLQSTPETPFDQNIYDGLYARLAVLKSRAASLPKYTIISKQVDNLKAQVDIFYKLDKAAKRPITGSIVTPAESAISVSVESILKLELALKRGDNPPESNGP
jgi:hypothetical protein